MSSEKQTRGLLLLTGLTPVGLGSHRVCYRHPDHPDRCVKVLIVNVPGKAMTDQRIAAGPASFRPVVDENTLELETYGELERTGNPAIWNHIPRCHGMVETDCGPGLCIDYVTGPDGMPAESLTQRIERNYDASCRKALEELKNFLLKHLVRIGDLHQSNLLIRGVPGEGRERIYIIDGLADRHFLWWRCFYPVRRFKVRRKIQRMEFRIRVQHELAEKSKASPA